MFGGGQTSAVPTLIVHGAKDAMCPQFHADHLMENIMNSKMKVMEEGKHNLHLRHSHEFNQITEQFLTQTSMLLSLVINYSL